MEKWNHESMSRTLTSKLRIMKTTKTKTLKGLLSTLTVAIALISHSTFAQCPNNNYQFGTSTAPSIVNQTATLSTCMYGGEYRLVTGLVAGSQYQFSTCGDSDFDTQITVYDAVTGGYIAYNDDACGLQSTVTFTSNGNNVRVLIDKYYCSSQSSCMTLTATRLTGGAPPANPCNSVVALSCGISESYSLSGQGAWLPGGPWGTPGEEQVYSFTPTISGSHSILVNNSGGYVDLFIKSGSCGSSGWTYIDDIYSSGTNSVTLNAGTTYYFLIDDENTSSSSGTITVNCPTPAVDPCTVITDITNCDQNYSYSLGAGNGQYNPTSGPWGTPGKEKVFSYTAPATGSYSIDMTHSGGGWSDLFISTSCGSTGWSYIDDVYSSATNTVSLTAGTTYYFLIDDENTSPSSGTININCPCIGPANGIDYSISVAGNTSVSGNTSGACNDCSFRSSEDETWEVAIPCPGTYTFSLCNNASWDTYMYLTTAPCGGTILSLNDDNCSLRSSITYTFANAGTYYVTVEGFSSYSGGAYAMDISKQCDLVMSTQTSSYACGYNISCNGSSDGSISATANGCGNITYTWSNGEASNAINNLTAGTYSVTATDEWGCSASSGDIVLSEPAPVVASTYGDATVYFGYDPLACADMGGSASGGCPGYTYSWSDGTSGATNSVCPQVSTTYTMTATDQNGCTATSDVDICVIDVRCYAGNSGNQKVEVCHNGHTICINENAVPAHLAHGCMLGDCSETTSCYANSRTVPGYTEDISNNAELLLYPNPTDSWITIDFVANSNSTIEVGLYNAMGQLISEIYSGGTTASEMLTFDVNTANLKGGIYIIKIIDENGKIISERFTRK